VIGERFTFAVISTLNIWSRPALLDGTVKCRRGAPVRIADAGGKNEYVPANDRNATDGYRSAPPCGV
jgi:hypothetical protein